MHSSREHHAQRTTGFQCSRPEGYATTIKGQEPPEHLDMWNPRRSAVPGLRLARLGTTHPALAVACTSSLSIMHHDMCCTAVHRISVPIASLECGCNVALYEPPGQQNNPS
jgi:hypothetical protein